MGARRVQFQSPGAFSSAWVYSFPEKAPAGKSDTAKNKCTLCSLLGSLSNLGIIIIDDYWIAMVGFCENKGKRRTDPQILRSWFLYIATKSVPFESPLLILLTAQQHPYGIHCEVVNKHVCQL